MEATSQEPARTIADRYAVVRVLGEGSAARTMLCRDTVTDREVALKELRMQHVGEFKHLELFEREAKVLGGLRHHAIPEVFDSFEAADPDGRPLLYLVQEYIDGASLAQRLEQGPALGQVELLQLTMGILDALEYLHGRSPPVYHRDIKPSNIVVRSTGAPVLVDFGSVTHGWRSTETSGSTVTGTFGYMPPEQLLGQVGPTSDLYALGATLLHVLTGRAPTEFSFDSGRIEVPHDLPAPAGLRALVTALLEPAPRRRPADVAAARAILLERDRPPSTALVALEAGMPAVYGGGGPRPVDVGPPPRDPNGPLGDVYRLLVDPWGGRIHPTLRVAALVGLTLCTVGILPVVYLVDRRSRRRRYHDLFCHGQSVAGVISSVRGQEHYNSYATFVYDYQANGIACRGHFDFPMGKSKWISTGDAVVVLYDPEDPARSCLVFRED